MVDFCNPGVLGTPQQFRRTYEAPILAGRQTRQVGQRATVALNMKISIHHTCLTSIPSWTIPPSHVMYNLPGPLHSAWGEGAPWGEGTPIAHSITLLKPISGREPGASPEIEAEGQARSAELSSLVNPFILRRTNALLSQHLPPKVSPMWSINKLATIPPPFHLILSSSITEREGDGFTRIRSQLTLHPRESQAYI